MFAGWVSRPAPEVETITCADVRTTPDLSTTKPEPSSSDEAPGFAPKYEKTVTTPGARCAKIRCGAKPFASTGLETTTIEGTDERTSGSRTRTVCCPPLSQPPLSTANSTPPAPADAARAHKATTSAGRTHPG